MKQRRTQNGNDNERDSTFKDHQQLLETSDLITSKRRYRVASNRSNVIRPQLSTWPNNWQEQLWKDPTEDGRSLKETREASNQQFLKLEDEATIRSLVSLQGKIYYPQPAKKQKKPKPEKRGIVVPLPDIGPPLKWKLGTEVAALERDFPFGGALPTLHDGTEVNLKTKKSFHPKRKDSFAKFLNWATTNNPDQVPLVHDVFDQVRNEQGKMLVIAPLLVGFLNETTHFHMF